MTRNVLQQHPSRLIKPLSLGDGGTNAKTPAQARQNLNAIALTQIGQPNGITPLNANGKIPFEHLPSPDIHSVSITGPSKCYLGRSVTYTITDYDLDTMYSVSSGDGDISIIKDSVIFTPNSLGVCHFTVKDNQYSVDVSKIPTPIITSPSNNATNVYTLTPFTLSLAAILLDQEHVAIAFVRWEIATDVNFTNIVDSLMAGAPGGALDTWQCPWTSSELDLSTDYWVRVRIQSSLGDTGGWSESVKFTTAAIIIPITLSSRFLANTDPDTVSAQIGDITSLSGNGEVLAVTDMYNRQVEIYKKIANAWVYQSSVIRPVIADIIDNGFQFGVAITLSFTGDTLMASEPLAESRTIALGTIGAVYYFKTSTPGDFTSFAFEQLILPNTPLILGQFGREILLSDNDEQLFIAKYINENTVGGAVEIYALNTGVYEFVTQINNPELVPNAGSSYFALSHISINTTGTRLVIGDNARQTLDASGTSGPLSQGRTYIFDYVVDTWALSDTIEITKTTPNVDPSYFYISWSNHLSPDGKILFIVVYYSIEQYDEVMDNTTYTDVNSVYIYEDVAGTWTLRQELSINDWLSSSFSQGFADIIRSSETGDRFVVGCGVANSHNLIPLGVIGEDFPQTGIGWLFVREGNTWSLVHTYDGPYTDPVDLSKRPCFGMQTLINRAGDMVIISAPGSEHSDVGYIGGTIYGEVLIYT